MYKTTVYLSETHRAEIKMTSRTDGCTEVEVIRDVLDTYFEQRRGTLPSIFRKGSGGKIPASSSEDWLLGNWKPE